MSIKSNYHSIRFHIPDWVTIVGAVKQRSKEEVIELIEAGIQDIGENYVQEAESLREELGDYASKVRWHMIGHLQSNKIKKAISAFDMIQTISSIKQSQDINRRIEETTKRKISCLIEVNIGAEDSKSGMGADLEVITDLARTISRLPFLTLDGFMTIGPFSEDPEESRPYFKQTKIIFDKIKDLDLHDVSLKILSMGMSNNYTVAIEEGANMIRLGTVIFGPRKG